MPTNPTTFFVASRMHPCDLADCSCVDYHAKPSGHCVCGHLVGSHMQPDEFEAFQKQQREDPAAQKAEAPVAQWPSPTMPCPDCAELVLVGANVCKHCGYRFDGVPRQAKTPGTAAFLSFLWWGLGHIYAGRLGLGIYLLLFDVLAIAITILGIGFPLILTIPYAIWVMVHSYRSTEDVNAGRPPRSATALVVAPWIVILIGAIIIAAIINS